jgi:hypothetical protein
MTETTDPGGSDPAPADPALSDRLPADGQSITARRAITAPATVDRAARTVEVVWSTGARARNFVPSLGGITEELDMSPNAVRMAQLGSGNAPVLNTHRSSDARDVLGRVIAARLEGGRGHARLQFSGAADVEPLWQRIADGTLRAVSIGYRVHRYEQRPDPVSGEMIYRAVDWEPLEISIVPIPVDRDAQVRGAAPQGAPSFAIEPALENEEPPMTETTPEIPAAPLAPPAASPPATITVETPPDLEALRAEAQRAERERITGIDGAIDAARALVGTETAAHIRREAVERGWHPDQARRSLFDAMVKSAAPPSVPARPETGPGHDSPSEILDAMAEALATRSMPGYQPQGNRRQTVRFGPEVAFAQIGIIGFDGQIELEALRLYGLPEDAPAVLSGCPALPAGGRTLMFSASWDLPSMPPGATTNADVTVPGARRGDFADASLDTSSISFVLDCHVWSNDKVRVTARNVSASTVDLAVAALSVQVVKRRVP